MGVAVVTGGFGIDVRGDFKQVTRMLSDVQKKAVPIAGVRALNKTIKPTQAAVVKSLSKGIGITQKAARKHLRIHKANKNNLLAAIVASGLRFSLIDLGAKQIGKRKNSRNKKTGKFKGRRVVGKGGVTYKGRDGVKKFIPGAFIAEMRNGSRGVFRRRGLRRLPIDKKFGPSIPHVFIQKAAQMVMKETANKRWKKTFEHEMSFELSKPRYR